MTEKYAELDAALDHVVAAARAHLAAVKAADGEPDDDAVWNAYVTLNNASRAYDEALNDIFGEVTPWDLEEITPEEAEGRLATVTSLAGEEPSGDDPYPAVVSVRQRRDYRVPSVASLLRAAEAARVGLPQVEGEALAPITTVGEAVLELLQAGDGSLAMLDLPQLDPLDGVVLVAEVDEAFNPDVEDADAGRPFLLRGDDRVVGRLDERPFADLDDDL
jgi:hypothetical protein